MYKDHPTAGDPWRFFDHYLKGEDNGVPRDRPVHYYVMGSPDDRSERGNHWRSADQWPPPAVETPFYFHMDHSLRREKPPSGNLRRTFRYDPKNPVPTKGGGNYRLPSGPLDQSELESRTDVVLFSTEALAAPVEVTGRVIANLYISSNCPDTDFTVKLTDVYPNGVSRLVTDGIFRARYHASPRCETESLLQPGKVYSLPVDLWTTSMVFDAGHRIRVAVSSSNSPKFDPNPNTGKPFRADGEVRIATNAVHTSSEYPSHIILPIYAGPPDPPARVQ
jgi:putative CocE/NonD family hydrolase